jgi:3',5'-cyclic AMP phosphodiesterase CpdA
LLLTQCFSFGPHELPTSGSERDINLRALSLLAETPAGEPLRFAVIGDVQLAFDEAEIVVERLGRIEGLAFVVQLGDFTDLGMLDEYQLMNEIFRRLDVPYLVVVGNHDLLGNGGAIYDRMFGPRRLAFTYGRTRFVLLDTNSREYGFGGRVPDLAWLAERLVPDGDHDRAVVLSHVPPTSGDFDPALREPFHALLAERGVEISFHAHEHRYEDRQRDGVRYVLADAAAGRSFLLVSEHPSGELEVERRWF